MSTDMDTITSPPAAHPAANTATPPLPVMLIPLQCLACGNRLASILNLQTGVFTHIHQPMANAPNCGATGKKYQIGHNGVEEVHA